MKLYLVWKSRNNDLGNERAALSWDKYPEIIQKVLYLQFAVNVCIATYQRRAADSKKSKVSRIHSEDLDAQKPSQPETLNKCTFS